MEKNLENSNPKALASPTTSSGKIPVTTSYSVSIYKRLEKYTQDNGLDKVQDSVRIAVSKFLTSEGY